MNADVALGKRSNVLGKPRGHVPVEDRLDEIIATSARLFSDRGFSATRLNDVADALGVTRPALYYYFPNGKMQILEVICSKSMDSGEEALRKALEKETPLDQLREFASLSAEVTTRDESRVFHREISQLDAGFRQEINGRVRSHYAQVVKIIRKGIDEGQVRADLDPRLATEAFMGMIQWMSQWFRFGPKHASAEEVGALFADIFLNGAASDD